MTLLLSIGFWGASWLAVSALGDVALDSLLREKEEIEKWAAVARPSHPQQRCGFVGYPDTPRTRGNETPTSATRRWPGIRV